MNTTTLVLLTLFILIVGTYLTRIFPAQRVSLINAIRNFYNFAGQIGGYVNNTAISYWIPPMRMHYVTGTWADAAGAVANTIAKTCSLGDNTAVITIPVVPLQSSVAAQGFYLTSVNVWFESLTAAPTALDALIFSNTLPADTAVMVAAAVTFDYDTGHDTAGERDNVDQHKMTLTLTTPVWIDNDMIYNVQITIDGATNTVIHSLGARVNGTLRL